MQFQEQTGKSIKESFEEFNKKNPHVYDMFKGQVYRAKSKNRSKVSSKAIINWMRWEVSINTKSADVYKINDAFTSHYARLFIKDHPQYADMFELRELRDGSEAGMIDRKIADEYMTKILNKMKSGFSIIHYSNNTAMLIPIGEMPFETEDITTVAFNKLLKAKLIRSYYKTHHSEEFRISKAGLEIVKPHVGVKQNNDAIVITVTDKKKGKKKK